MVVRPAYHEWGPDGALRAYDLAVIEHQRALDHQSVLRKQDHKADELAVSAAQRAIDGAGGIAVIAGLVRDALTLAGAWHRRRASGAISLRLAG